MDEQYTKARFWKCALQVNPASYIQYRGTDHQLTEAEYNQKLLDVCLEEGIKVLGIADHGSVDGINAIRGLMAQQGIVVFPGFEIASSEKAHFVCLFEEDTTIQQLERYLGNLKLLDIQDGIRPSRLSAEQLLQEVNELGGFVYAAHCTGDSGVLKSKLNHVWQSPYLKAAQIPGTLEDFKTDAGQCYRQILLNKDLGYKRERPLALINAKDVEKPETLRDPKASCLIKMTKPCFASFKQAFLDPESRIRLNSDIPEHPASSIKSVRFVGGYLDGSDIDPMLWDEQQDGVTIEFSDHLNAVIGGRGTGKSTLLECIRYAMDLKPLGKEAKKHHDEIIRENLGNEKGLVELSIRSSAMNGRRFTVSRRYGDAPTVKDETGKISNFTPAELLPHMEMFGQNEIYEITRDRASQLRLVNRFFDGEHSAYDERIQAILKKLKENRQSILQAKEKLTEVEAEVARLPKLKEQLLQYQSLGLEEKLKVLPALENEKRLSARISEELESVRSALDTLGESLPDTIFINDNIISKLPHSNLLREIRQTLEQLGTDVRTSHAQLLASYSQKETTLKQWQAQLVIAIAEEERLLEQSFKDIPASEGKSGREIGVQYQNLIREVERIQPKEKSLRNHQAVVTEHDQARKALLAELSEIRAERSARLQRSLKRLNKQLAGKLRLTVKAEANRKPFTDFLQRCNLEGVGPKRLVWVEEGDFSPTALVTTIRLGTDSLKNTGWGITPGVAEALARLSLLKRMELEELELPDVILIELNIAHSGQPEQYRELERLSTGQQCTAILHLLLLDNPDPLLLDQPEDNLDNAFIAERIVAELRSAKVARQFLFATHNANIPVFGDAEWIGVLSVVDGKAHIPPEQQGAIDLPEIQQLAADILEGGKSAFNQRREKYGFN